MFHFQYPKFKSTSLVLCLFLFVLISSSCQTSNPQPAIRVVIISLNPPTATVQIENKQPNDIPPTSTAITPLNVVADKPVVISCNCTGVPNVSVALKVTGGVPPYKLVSENLQIEGDSYLLPLSGATSKTLVVQSYDGQEFRIDIPIEECAPPPTCSVTPQKTKRQDDDSDENLPTTSLPTVPPTLPPTVPPTLPPTVPPTLTNIPPGRSHACNDGIDNDHDGKTDYPDDPECLKRNDDDESQ